MAYATRTTHSATGSAVLHFPSPPRHPIYQPPLSSDPAPRAITALFKRKWMNVASPWLTAEDGDDAPHPAVGQITAGLGHSHGGGGCAAETQGWSRNPAFLRSLRPCALSGTSRERAPLLNAHPSPPAPWRHVVCRRHAYFQPSLPLLWPLLGRDVTGFRRTWWGGGGGVDGGGGEDKEGRGGVSMGGVWKGVS